MFYKSIAVITIFSASTLVSAFSAQAGGFSRHTGSGAHASANSGTSVYAKTKRSRYRSKTSAHASVDVLYGGKIAIGQAYATNKTSFYAVGKSKYKQWKSTKAKVYAKGGNIVAKARATNYVTVKAAGKTYLVSKEVARSIARFTPLGTTATAASQTYLSGSSSGYLGVKTGSTSRAVVRVRR